jgi:hypothetical protein
MQKRNFLTFASLLLASLSLCNSPAFSQETLALEKLSLTPTADSAFELGYLRADIFSDGSIGLHGRMELNVNNREGYYRLIVDVEKETYKAVPLTEAEKKALLTRTETGSKSLNALRSPEDSNPSMRAFPLVTYYTATLNLLSEDPINVDLCKTTGNLSWYDNGSTVTATTGNPIFTPYNPTAAGTHWFLESSYAYFLYPVGTPVASNRAWAGATYYNWDFPPADEKTSVDHWVSLEFFPMLPNGVVGYYDFDYLAYGQTSYAISTTFSWNLTY